MSKLQFLITCLIVMIVFFVVVLVSGFFMFAAALKHDVPSALVNLLSMLVFTGAIKFVHSYATTASAR